MAPTGEGFLQGLGLASLGATGIILLILAIRRLSPGGAGTWRMAFWVILVLRMATAQAFSFHPRFLRPCLWTNCVTSFCTNWLT